MDAATAGGAAAATATALAVAVVAAVAAGKVALLGRALRGAFRGALRALAITIKGARWSGVTFKSYPQGRVNFCKLLSAKPWTCISFVFLTFLIRYDLIIISVHFLGHD